MALMPILRLKDAAAATDRALAAANGRRRERILSRASVADLIGRVRDGEPWAAADGGTVTNAYGHRSVTTVALAARVGDRIAVGVGVCEAVAPSPGRVWAVLKPWGRGDLTARLAAWALLPGVFAVDAMDDEGGGR